MSIEADYKKEVQDRKKEFQDKKLNLISQLCTDGAQKTKKQKIDSK